MKGCNYLGAKFYHLAVLGHGFRTLDKELVKQTNNNTKNREAGTKAKPWNLELTWLEKTDSPEQHERLEVVSDL